MNNQDKDNQEQAGLNQALKGKAIKKEISEDHSENLGLDADRSSDDQRIDRRYNMDNDMISHNPGGENDDSDANTKRGSSPLMDK